MLPRLNWIIRYVEGLENRVEKMEKLLSMASIIPVLSILTIMTDRLMNSLPWTVNIAQDSMNFESTLVVLAKIPTMQEHRMSSLHSLFRTTLSLLRHSTLCQKVLAVTPRMRQMTKTELITGNDYI